MYSKTTSISATPGLRICDSRIRFNILRNISSKKVFKPLTLAQSATELPTRTIPESQQGKWVGQDEYTELADRIDAPPLPLPAVSTPVTVVLVRHGQSTWNAASRIQGSSNLSVLTEKGRKQAATAAQMLQGRIFSRMYVSPLARAQETANIIWEGRAAIPREDIPVLREIDLYSFQGYDKSELKAMYPELRRMWQEQPEKFEMDGHAPVRELWHRASVAWQSILSTNTQSPSPSTTNPSSSAPDSVLVVAHNNTNQALVATALGLPPSYLRRMLQNNAALTVLQVSPKQSGGSPASKVVLECLNQSPANPFKQDDKVTARVVLVVKSDDPQHQQAVAQLLAQTQVDALLCGPFKAAQEAAELACGAQVAAGHTEPDVVTLLEAGGALACNEVWSSILERAERPGPAAFSQAADSSEGAPTRTVAVITDSSATGALLCRALGLGVESLDLFRFTPGGLTLLEFSGRPSSSKAVARSINSAAHLQQ